MPIFDLGYRPWEGTAQKTSRAWPIFRESLLYGLRTKWLKLFYAVAWAPCVIASVVRYFQYTFAALYPDDENLQRLIHSVDDSFYFRFQLAQTCIMAALAAMIGPSLIAEDRRANALELYLSRPITRADYLLGKAGALFCFLLSVTLAPNVLLWFVESTMSPNYQGFTENWDYVLRAISYDVLICAACTLVVLALSSLTRSAGMGITYWVVALLGSGMIGGALHGLTGNRSLAIVSLLRTSNAVCRTFFGMPPSLDDPQFASAFFVLVALSTGSLILLWRRLRGTEVFR